MCTVSALCVRAASYQQYASACSGGVSLWHVPGELEAYPDLGRLRDWLCPGRPRFAARTREDAEDFFISSLARWRDALGLDKVRSGCHTLYRP